MPPFFQPRIAKKINMAPSVRVIVICSDPRLLWRDFYKGVDRALTPDESILHNIIIIIISYLFCTLYLFYLDIPFFVNGMKCWHFYIDWEFFCELYSWFFLLLSQSSIYWHFIDIVWLKKNSAHGVSHMTGSLSFLSKKKSHRGTLKDIFSIGQHSDRPKRGLDIKSIIRDWVANSSSQSVDGC